MTTPSPKLTPFQLQKDIWFTLGLVKVFGPLNKKEINPDVYLYVADRYGHLANHYERLGNKQRAERLHRQAAYYFQLGGGRTPPAKAMAAGIPRPPLFTEAIGHYDSDNDEAA